MINYVNIKLLPNISKSRFKDKLSLDAKCVISLEINFIDLSLELSWFSSLVSLTISNLF